MLKITALSLACFMLAACKTMDMSYPVSKFTRIESAEFSELMTTYDSNSDRSYGMEPGDVKFYGPKIGYFLYTHGRLHAYKSANGDTNYSFIAALSYQEEFLRKYDTVTDMSGTKLPFKTNSAFQDNGGYMKEFIEVSLTKEQLEEAQYDGLFLTFAAREHERTAAQRRANRGLSFGEVMRLADEGNSGSATRRTENDNFDLTVPSNYIVNFLNRVN